MAETTIEEIYCRRELCDFAIKNPVLRRICADIDFLLEEVDRLKAENERLRKFEEQNIYMSMFSDSHVGDD